MRDLETAKKCVGRIASGVFIVTTGAGANGTGFLASWIQQISLDPMLLVVCIKAGRPVIQPIFDHGGFAINVLSTVNRDLIKHFAKGFKPGENAFENLPLEFGALETPFLTNTLANVECELHGHAQPGDHVLFFGKPIHGVMRAKENPLAHFRPSGAIY